VFSVSGKMFGVTGQTGPRQVDCSIDVGQQQQTMPRDRRYGTYIEMLQQRCLAVSQLEGYLQAGPYSLWPMDWTVAAAAGAAAAAVSHALN